MAFDFRELAVPILVAPMAGGPSTPALAAAGTNAGGVGFVAAGYLTAEVFAERITAARGLTSGPIGANLFVPQVSAGTPDGIARYAEALAPEAEHYGAQLGEPRFDDDHWAAKIEVLLDLRPDVASCTFGVPSAQECLRLREAGIAVVGSVTTLAEAQIALDCGVDAVAVQGPSAGGHRGTFDPGAQPATQPLDELLADVIAAVEVPVVAAGGVVTAGAVRAALAAGGGGAPTCAAGLLPRPTGERPPPPRAVHGPPRNHDP